jgi:hypothetical protein
MAFNDRPMEEQKPPGNANPIGDSLGGLIQNPDLNAEAEPRQHAIRDVNQAREVIRTIMAAGERRATVNARIAWKLNAERPYNQKQLEEEGLGWRTNVSTRVLTTIIDKVWPRFVEAVQGLKFFTNSSLSNKWANNTEKTESFRQVITDTIREHPGWMDLLEQVASTNTTYGHEICAWLDKTSFWCRAFSHEDSHVTDGCRQLPKFAQVVVLHEKLMPHELYAYIKDEAESRTVGWRIENTIKQINKASPAQLRDELNSCGNVSTWYANAARELTLGSSYMAGASVISVYNLLAQEVSGKVSHYRLAGNELDLIFSMDERFDSPEDCMAFFSYERGNGTLHGSKGIGRAAYELAAMLDRARNELIDRAIMSGKVMVQGDIKRLHTFKMSVVGSTCIIPNGWQVLEHRIDGNPEPFLKLDAYISSLVDAIVGNVSPPQITASGDAMRSSASWQLLAAREEEGKDARITRFLTQFVGMIQTMQKRICDPMVTDEAAKAARKKLTDKGLSDEEIAELAASPVAGTVVDLTPIERQMVVALAQEKAGNPLYNQRQLQVEDVTARLGADFAERVILPTEDPTEEVEQTTQQQLEITLLAHGQPVGVSPRDNDEIHLKVLLPSTEQLANQVMQGQMDTSSLEAMLSHITAHVNSAQQKGVPAEVLKPAMDLVKRAGPALAQLKDLDAQAAALKQQDEEQAAPAPA